MHNDDGGTFRFEIFVTDGGSLPKVLESYFDPRAPNAGESKLPRSGAFLI